MLSEIYRRSGQATTYTSMELQFWKQQPNEWQKTRDQESCQKHLDHFEIPQSF